MRLEPIVRPMFDRLLQVPQAELIEAHSTVETMSARYKRHLTLTALKGPWEGFINVERQGLLLAELAEGVPSICLLSLMYWKQAWTGPLRSIDQLQSRRKLRPRSSLPS